MSAPLIVAERPRFNLFGKEFVVPFTKERDFRPENPYGSLPRSLRRKIEHNRGNAYYDGQIEYLTEFDVNIGGGKIVRQRAYSAIHRDDSFRGIGISVFAHDRGSRQIYIGRDNIEVFTRRLGMRRKLRLADIPFLGYKEPPTES